MAEGRARAREEAEREQSLREARLEAIRMKVRPVVPDDPTRLLAYTAKIETKEANLLTWLKMGRVVLLCDVEACASLSGFVCSSFYRFGVYEVELMPCLRSAVYGPRGSRPLLHTICLCQLGYKAPTMQKIFVDIKNQLKPVKRLHPLIVFHVIVTLVVDFNSAAAKILVGFSSKANLNRFSPIRFIRHSISQNLDLPPAFQAPLS
ncbi:unnamed protein product [Dibothriocephalus latus]|uniref:Uncharacterized protein n=1 Tax=Dibothriocephalus latus TaxID=60516 RepID=A0A3P7N269_DIBLA|nr:unnamed protein product [Dibothriocephalus latus]